MRFLIALIVVLLLSCGVLLYLLVRRRPYGTTRAGRRDGVYIPRRLPTGDTLAQLVARFQHVADTNLFGSRLARLYALLFDPDLVLPYLDDTFLVHQVESSSIANNTALFLSVAAIEQAVEGRVFGDNPANTLGAYLRAEFKKRDWTWPTHPLAWKQFFLDQYVDALFDRPSKRPRYLPIT